MTTEPSTDGLTFTHDCYGTPVRIFMWEGCPWFEASALCVAMGLDPAVIATFNAKADDTDIALYPFDDEPVPALSPIGHWKFVERHGGPRDAKYAAWSRREATKLIPEPHAEDARQRLTLNPDGSRPEYPNRYSGRLGEWKELLFHPNYRSANAILSAQHIAQMRVITADAKTKSATRPMGISRPSDRAQPNQQRAN